jgi:selenide, water dikinase
MATEPQEVSQFVSPLTAMCSSGGCTAKYGGAALRTLLSDLGRPHPDLLVGIESPDDAAIYRLDESSGIVASVDFFPPLVDDPFTYGQISANNAINDIYAMGGTPAFALSVAAFPEELPLSSAARILAGAAKQCEAVGAVLAGGHTIRSAEPKFGLAVVGFVELDGVWRKNGAQAGDELYLSKPLGGGLVLSGRRNGQASQEELDSAVAWMTLPGKEIAAAVANVQPHAVTDVTGFGLLGHADEIAAASGIKLAIESRRLQAMQGAMRLARDGVRTSGDERNRELLAGRLSVEEGVDPALLALALDPQTAGGMLIALAPGEAEQLSRAACQADMTVERIGYAEPGTGVRLIA